MPRPISPTTNARARARIKTGIVQTSPYPNPRWSRYIARSDVRGRRAVAYDLRNAAVGRQLAAQTLKQTIALKATRYTLRSVRARQRPSLRQGVQSIRPRAPRKVDPVALRKSARNYSKAYRDTVQQGNISSAPTRSSRERVRALGIAFAVRGAYSGARAARRGARRGARAIRVRRDSKGRFAGSW